MLGAYAFNRNNIKSSDAQLNLIGAKSLNSKATAYIVAIGINEYANSQYNLHYAKSDALDFGDTVRSAQQRLGTFARAEVIGLLNQDATKANILDVLRALAGMKVSPPSGFFRDQLARIERAQPEDAVFIYFAGHGASWQNHFHLIPYDLGYMGAPGKYDIAGWDELMSHSISDSELQPMLEDLDAGQMVLTIDACNSGRALDDEEKRQGPMNSKGLAQLAYDKGMYILTASQSRQAALEVAELKHGLLTYTLLEQGLKDGLADFQPTDGQVEVREWLEFATQRVPQIEEAKIKEAHEQGHEIAFVEGEESTRGPAERSLQRPRAFSPRKPETRPFIVARIK
jgi:uncharacterized caspase-like protein